MSRKAQQQLVNQRFATIQNNKAQKGFKWGFSDKTGWEWLDMSAKLAIPIVVLAATIGLGLWQAHLTDLQHQSDQASTLDQERQATLVKYEDDMKDLLLHTNLLTSKPDDEIRVIALTETLSAMNQLDPKRISFLIRFLQNAHLNGKDPFMTASYTIVSFSTTDLSAIDFNGADLHYADLSGANLDGTNLTDADLIGVYLQDVELSNANLSGALNLTQQQLNQVLNCKEAILPPLLTCHHNSTP